MAAAKKLVTVAPSPTVTTFHDATGGPTTFVRFGLYDGAFDSTATLLNSDKDENDNFVGADTRRFFVKVTDPSTASPTVKKKRTITASWSTFLDDKKTLRDDGGGNPAIDLVETKPGSGEYVSSWLMLASDRWEIDNVQTTTGRAGEGIRSKGNKDYRLRHATLFDLVGVQFPPKSGALTFVPIFRPSPEERRKIPLQIFIVGPNPALATYAASKDLENIRIVYARAGLWPFTVVDPSLPGTVVKVGTEEVMVVPMPKTIANPNALTDDDLRLLARIYPGLQASGASGVPPKIENGAVCLTETIRIFYVPPMATGDNGDTYADLLNSTSSLRGASFIADWSSKLVSGMGSSAAHEIGHTLTNHPKGHYVEPVPPKRLFAPSNLMCDGSVAHIGDVASSQRLWDANDGALLNQYDVIRASRYTRSFTP